MSSTCRSGAGYGQREDDLAQACNNAVAAGIVVVASAGNDGDKPFVVSSPSVGPGVVSVAQTQVATAFGIPLVVTAPASIAGVYSNTATLDFAPVGAGVANTSVVFVGRGCVGDAYAADPAGKIALIDRGVCAVSEKIDRAANAGAVGVLIGLVAPGDAQSFSQGNGSLFVPSLVITQSTSNIDQRAPQRVRTSWSQRCRRPTAFRSPIAWSRRRLAGPAYSYGTLKPDIGAPGASVSALAGTGSGEAAFGGTSGAAPMVSGAAALVIQAAPDANADRGQGHCSWVRPRRPSSPTP